VREAVRYLAELGHTQIALVTSSESELIDRYGPTARGNDGLRAVMAQPLMPRALQCADDAQTGRMVSPISWTTHQIAVGHHHRSCICPPTSSSCSQVSHNLTYAVCTLWAKSHRVMFVGATAFSGSPLVSRGTSWTWGTTGVSRQSFDT
jgi:hypothetical protein